jgi:hypothetical protein
MKVVIISSFLWMSVNYNRISLFVFLPLNFEQMASQEFYRLEYDTV